MTTTLGEIVVELDAENATITTVNFLDLVESGRLDGATFYRVVTPENQPGDGVKIEVIQGGLGGNPAAEETKPIEHETTKATGLRHLDGTISMARSAPGTASSEFFICVGDQPELDFGGRRNPDGQGFAAFGRVVEGMDVVRAIHGLPNEKQRLKEPVRITSIRRDDS
ncbi:MAG: peptidylprolyl isomerase [Thermoanaerobaculia bacterium]|nr:peptidylprolyl isomerase [Thermoanaerobaculia bacterium]